MPATNARIHKLGQDIVKRRVANGWDQKTLAGQASVNPGYLSTIERGIKQPSLGTLHKLRVALVISDDAWLRWLDMLVDDQAAA